MDTFLNNGPLNRPATVNTVAATPSFRRSSGVERRAVNSLVGGSNPSAGAMNSKRTGSKRK